MVTRIIYLCRSVSPLSLHRHTPPHPVETPASSGEFCQDLSKLSNISMCQFIPGVPGSHRYLRRLPELAPNHAGSRSVSGGGYNVIITDIWLRTGHSN